MPFEDEVWSNMRYKTLILLPLLVIFLACAGQGEYVHPVGGPHDPAPSWWGMDAVCSPGCPVGSSAW
ncbi:MAG: hypothetical protein QME75_03970 [Deltaproteobacteria bacterium]|nr:hypothetical protein [Deltaproteobacteria bacterium]